MAYQILKNRLTNGVPFQTSVAVERINTLANNLELTQSEAEELLALAEQNGSNEGAGIEARIAQLEQASLEHDLALVELAELITGGM